MTLAVVATLCTLTSCFKDDEELQRQLIELRATVEAKTKAAEKAEAEAADLRSKLKNGSSSGGSGASSEDLARAKSTIADLTKQIEDLKKAAAGAGAGGAPTKFDMDAMAAKLDEDLTRKAKQLRELVKGQISSGRIDEVALKSIEYPPQIVAPFTSAITFNVVTQAGQSIRLMFPVTADLSGSWKLPSVADVEAAYKMATSSPQLAGSPTGGTPAPPPAAPGVPPVSGGGVTPQPQPHAGGGSRVRQIDGNTFAFDWGDDPAPSPSPAPAPAPQPGPAAPQAPLSGQPTPGVPAPGPAAPAPAPAPAAPAPLMPVVGDKVIRFD